MAALVRILGRQCLLPYGRQCMLQNQSLVAQKRTVVSAYEEMRKYWEKNRQLKRPLSPFLTVYKPHLAMMTSLTHRVTGVVMQCSVALLSITLLALPCDFTHYFELVKAMSLPPPVIILAKAILAFPVTYHFLNGIRHLAWDAGVGFSLSTLYKTGYFVMGLTAIVIAYFVFGIHTNC